MTEGELFFMPVVAQPDLNLSSARYKVRGIYISKYIVHLVRNRRPGSLRFDVDDDSGLVVK